MHPALSVIFFTTASGAGYGMLMLLGLLALRGDLPTDSVTAFWMLLPTFALIAVGLVSSTFHLGHPERAWLAFSQWRSSWLSREGCLALATFLPAGIFAIGWFFLEEIGGIFAACALLAALLACATVLATSMIYASLKTVPQWRQGLVTPLYLAFALTTGSLLCSALLSLLGSAPNWLLWLTLVLLLATWAMKWAYWRAIDAATGSSTLGSATGLGQFGRVRPLDPPHTEENFLLREMGFRVARRHREKLRRIALGAGCLLPAVLLLAAAGSAQNLLAPVLILLTLPFVMLAVFVERWLFFAEATHKVTLYYGAASV